MAKIRIVAGSLRGSKIEVPDAPGLRPTPDRVRETLFNWLQPVIAGARALDLYAGSGALGIEAASRGAREVVLVERDRALAKKIESELVRLKVATARVTCEDAARFLAQPAQPFDLAFVDPPFGSGLWDETLARLDQGWLAPGAMVYVEAPRGQAIAVPATWTPHREGHAGEVAFALYRS